MATSSAAIPSTRRGKSGHFTIHSPAVKSRIPNSGQFRDLISEAFQVSVHRRFSFVFCADSTP